MFGDGCEMTGLLDWTDAPGSKLMFCVYVFLSEVAMVL